MSAITLAAALLGGAAVAGADEPQPAQDLPAQDPSAQDALPAEDPPASSDPSIDPATAPSSTPPSSAPGATATPADPPSPSRSSPLLSAADEIGDQAIGGAIGIAAGGHLTPGGLRVTGHYLYQLSERDWFDGIASFTFGSGAAGCFRDRSDTVVCDHGFASGGSVELAAGVRRMFASQGRFRPFARAAIGLAFVRFSDDDLTGVSIPLHVGAGLRARLSPSMGLVALADASFGIARFGRGLGGEPQFGLAITTGIEFRLP